MQKARTSKMQPYNLLLHSQHCAFWIVFNKLGWLSCGYALMDLGNIVLAVLRDAGVQGLP